MITHGIRGLDIRRKKIAKKIKFYDEKKCV